MDETGDVVIVGANLRLVQALDPNSAEQGKGNLIIGHFDTANTESTHSLIMGSGHQVSGEGHIVSGSNHIVSGMHSAAISGDHNALEGEYLSTLSGQDNTIVANYSSISGGGENLIENDHSSIAGGFQNEITGTYATIAGGFANKVSGHTASVAGGGTNRATAPGACRWRLCQCRCRKLECGPRRGLFASHRKLQCGGGGRLHEPFRRPVEHRDWWRCQYRLRHWRHIGWWSKNWTLGDYATVLGGYETHASDAHSIAPQQ